MEENIQILQYALNTLYLLFSAALVLWMGAGFAMLESGLVRSKNTVEILTKNVALFAIACVMYFLVGYGLMYQSGSEGFFPNLGLFDITEYTREDVLGEDAPSYPAMADLFFQMVFVATAMSIVSGAVAERMKLYSFLLFTVVMTAFIYPVVGFWTWGGGFLSEIGFFDFAGSGIVHMTGASAALAGVILLGSRKGKYNAEGRSMAFPGANLPLATLGTFILWIGWLGFNGGSQLLITSVDDANAVSKIMVNTNLAGCAGAISAMLLAFALFKKTDLTMLLNGALAGFVMVTASPASPSPLVACILGLLAGVIVVASILLIDKVKIDDPVGAISVHGVVGLISVLLVPLHNPETSFTAQLAGVALIFAWTFVISLIVWAALKYTIGIRLDEEHEVMGADISECGMEAYPEFLKK